MPTNPSASNVIKGNSELASQHRELGSQFSCLSIGQGIHAKIVCGAEMDGLDISCDSNMLPFVETIVQDRTLFMRFRPNVNTQTNSPVVVSVCMRSLAGLEVSSAARVSIVGIRAQELRVVLSSASSSDLQGQVENLLLSSSSSCELDASELAAQRAVIEASSCSKVLVNVQQTLSVNAHSCAQVQYVGSPNTSISASSGAVVRPAF